MAVRPIVTYNDHILTQVAKPVSKDMAELGVFIADMFETTDAHAM